MPSLLTKRQVTSLSAFQTGVRPNRERLMGSLAEMAAIGLQPDGSICRRGFSAEDVAGRALLAKWMNEAGLQVRVDTAGNLIFKATARNFNPMMAMAGKITVAEVEELVPAGELDPAQIHTPGIFVQRIFQGEKYEKRIEQRTVRNA